MDSHHIHNVGGHENTLREQKKRQTNFRASLSFSKEHTQGQKAT